MPYISKEERTGLAYRENQHANNAGQLNYLFTLLAHQYIKDHGLKYQHINDIIGALEGCKLELTRRLTNGYENEKIQMNGDVNETGCKLDV